MPRTTLIQGASRGIGLELVRQCVARGDRVFATCRRPDEAGGLGALAQQHPSLDVVALDLVDEATIAGAADTVAARTDRLDLLINAAGLLHDGDLQPEKRLSHVRADHLQRVFAVNAFGPVLVMKHFARFFEHGDPAVIANVSARVGSIADNGLGGWYAYRASKAAQNQFTRTAAIELKRRNRAIAVIALHPGTVETDLSAPFARRVKPEKLFSVDRAARQLLDLCDGAGPESNGCFFAWDGSSIPW